MFSILGMVSPEHTDATPVKIFRLMHTKTGSHFYTSDQNEATGLSYNGWVMEGQLGYCSLNNGAGLCPWYRLQGGDDDHFYTTSFEEATNSISIYHYHYEGIVCYVGAYGSC